MVCCFMNFHEKENSQNLVKHFDTEIEKAILFGCKWFVSGTESYEDEIFKERVLAAAKYYAAGEINYFGLKFNAQVLKDIFIQVADWEIYSYAVD